MRLFSFFFSVFSKSRATKNNKIKTSRPCKVAKTSPQFQFSNNKRAEMQDLNTGLSERKKKNGFFAIFCCLTTVKAIVCLLLQKKSKKKTWIDQLIATRPSTIVNCYITVESQLKSAVCAFLFQVEYINTVIKDNHWALR